MSLANDTFSAGTPAAANRSTTFFSTPHVMHAVVVTVGIESGKADEATAILRNQVVPDVKATPGFVSGTWARSEDGANGHSVVLFENEETAKAALALAKQGPPPGAPVKILYAEVYEVLAQA